MEKNANWLDMPVKGMDMTANHLELCNLHRSHCLNMNIGTLPVYSLEHYKETPSKASFRTEAELQP